MTIPGIEQGGDVGAALGVVPVLVLGPLQILAPILAGVFVALAGLLLRMFKPGAIKAGLRLLWRLKLALVAVAAVAAGLIWLAGSLRAGPGGVVHQAETGGHDWPLFRGGLQRTGAAPGAVGPTRGSVNWVWQEGGAGFLSSPAIVGNRLYAATATLGYLGGSGVILCLDADTGATVWESAPPGYIATFSSPSVAGKYLVCGEGLHVTRDARVVCLDVRPEQKGKVLWTYRTRSHVECTPVIAGDRVYVGAGDDGYYCFELEPDAQGQARLVWHLPGENYPDAETALAVHDGKVYAGLGNGGKALCVLDAATGRELHRIATPYPVFSPPAIAGGKLYVGMGTGDFVNKAEEIGQKPAGEVWCVDLETLRVDWRFPVGRTVLGAVAADGDEIYFGSRDGHVYAVARSGRPIGKCNLHAAIVSSPALTATHVYAMTAAGMLYAVDRRTLEPAWEIRVGTKPLFISSPAVARGRVYVGSQNDGLICAGEPGGEALALWPGPLGGPGKAGNLDGSPLPPHGAFLWQHPADQTGETDAAYVTAPAAAVKGAVCVPLAAGPKRGVMCLPAGARDEAPEPRWFYETPAGVWTSPVVAGDNVFVVDGRPGDAARHLYCLGLDAGQMRWRARVADDASGLLCAGPEHVYVQDAADALSCFGLAGQRLWSQPAGRLAAAPAVADGMLLVAWSEPAALLAMDRATGRVLWGVALEAAPRTSPAVRKDRVYVGTAAGLEARSLLDGAPVAGWRMEGGGVGGDFALGPSAVTYTSDRGELVVVDPANGSVLARAAGATPGLAPLVSRDVVLYAGADGLMQMRLSEPGAAPSLWMDTSWLGRAASPMVLVDSKIYMGRSGWGLVCLGASR